MKNVKTRIIAMVCMMIALFISFTPLTVMAAQPLDEILDYTIQVDDFVLNTSPVKAKFVKVVAKNFGTIPEWHLGAGGKAFIFIDEILDSSFLTLFLF